MASKAFHLPLSLVDPLTVRSVIQLGVILLGDLLSGRRRIRLGKGQGIVPLRALLSFGRREVTPFCGDGKGA